MPAEADLEGLEAVVPQLEQVRKINIDLERCHERRLMHADAIDFQRTPVVPEQQQ